MDAGKEQRGIAAEEPASVVKELVERIQNNTGDYLELFSVEINNEMADVIVADIESKFKNDGSEWLFSVPEQGETSCYEKIEGVAPTLSENETLVDIAL